MKMMSCSARWNRFPNPRSIRTYMQQVQYLRFRHSLAHGSRLFQADELGPPLPLRRGGERRLVMRPNPAPCRTSLEERRPVAP